MRGDLFLFFGILAVGYIVGQFLYLRNSYRNLQRLLSTDSKEAVFLRRQFRRRIQIAVLSGLGGICMIAGMLFSPKAYPSYFVFSWVLAAGFLIWTILLALVDFSSIRLYYRQIRNRNIDEENRLRLKLEQELKKKMTDE